MARLFFPNSQQPLELAGRTRNLSRGGVALLLRRMVTPGDGIELEVEMPQGNKLYMAGRIRFCRYVGMGFHELGVNLKAAGPTPVYPHVFSSTASMLDWLKRD